MPDLVLPLESLDAAQVSAAGGKGAALGELLRIDGVRVPRGWCLTTAAYQRVVAGRPELDEALDRLARLDPEDVAGSAAQAGRLRSILEAVPVPDEVVAAISDAVVALGPGQACAVRSSATAEDLPAASFAGQHDSYLDVVGAASVLEHVRRCWASLFTERAVAYRTRNGIDHRRVSMAVVVQEMADAQVSGVMFTADPVTGNRRTTTIEGAFGLGDALVSGLLAPDVFTVRDGDIVSLSLGAGEPLRPTLTEAQVLALAGLGRRIEAHFGRPQDLEWCLTEGGFQVVQSRPITTLFPVPSAPDDAPRVYLSVGHQQMMTDPMRPLGISVWQLTAAVPMHEAGNRLFVDATHHLASAANRDRFVAGITRSDPLTGDALRALVERGFVPLVPGDAEVPRFLAPADPLDPDPAIVAELVAANRASVRALRDELSARTGASLVAAIVADIPEMKRILFDPRSHQVFMLAMQAAEWLNEHLEQWLGERNVADVLTRSVAHNVTSQMGLALLDVADAIRPHPDVVSFLRNVGDDDGFLDALPALPGGAQVQAALRDFLDEYGMRCVGEIDITRPRWVERPTTLLPAILGHVDTFAPGEAHRRFERGREEAADKQREVLARLRELPDGESRAAETRLMIDRVRTFIGYREYPKYGIVSRYLAYKQALLGEADRLVRAGVLRDAEDVFFLTLPEIETVVRDRAADHALIRERRAAFAAAHALRPPRVLTSEGESVAGSYGNRPAPVGALVGLPVSAGTAEGRARVVLDLAGARMDPGDILVTRFTDPSWTPLFVTAGALVTEVGGLMTHGAVVAREYGLPAVVGVPDATALIRDGQRIRVNGTEGYVDVLP